MRPSRRRFLAGAVAGLLAGAGPWRPALAQPGRRWATGDRRLAPPALAGRDLLCAGDRSLILIDPDSDHPLWRRDHQLPDGAVFRPRPAGDLAVCGGQRQIGAWRLADGAAAWRYTARRQLGVPCVHGERVFVGDGHELIALGRADGQVHWRFPAVAGTLISYAPAAAADLVLVGPGDGRLYALAAADGRPRWAVDRMAEWQYLRQLQVSQAVPDILVAGSYKETLHGIAVADGRELWRFQAGNFINSHHLAGDGAYLWSPTGWLYALDIRSGQVRWRQRTTDYRNGPNRWASLLAELASRDGRLYALDLAHVVHVLSLADGQEVGRLALGELLRPFVLPLAGGRLLLGSETGDLLLTPAPPAMPLREST